MTAADHLADLDDALGVIDQAAFPNPAVIRKAIRAARNTLADLIQDMDELNARISMMEDDENGENR